MWVCDIDKAEFLKSFFAHYHSFYYSAHLSTYEPKRIPRLSGYLNYQKGSMRLCEVFSSDDLRFMWGFLFLLWFVWCFLLLLPSWFLSSLAWVMFPSFIFLFFLNLGHACFLLILFDFFLPFLLLLALHATALASTWNYIMVEDRNSSSSSWNVKLSIEVS